MAVGSVSFLSQEFLAQDKYKKRPKNAGPLYEVTYLRTYARWLEKLKRRETWAETVERVVNYSISLYVGPASDEELTKEAELMYDKVYNLEVLPAGRTLWVGGSGAANKFSISNFNCSYLDIAAPPKEYSYLSLDSFNCFKDIFYLLLCGSGVGYSVEKDKIATLPKLATDFQISHRPYTPMAKSLRSDNTLTYILEGNIQLISVGDSKDAWVKALATYFKILEGSKEPIQIEIDYNNVRPAGERLITFGGRAAGPRGLQIMFDKISKVIKQCDGQLTSVGAMDIANMIAENVLVGGTRRSAQIALGSPDDEQFKDAKKNLYIYDKATKKYILDPERSHRRMSNNTIVFDKKPSFDTIYGVFMNILNNGEPGFFNRESASKKRPKASGINPCSEILLDNFGVCNLSTVVITSHFMPNGYLDFNKLKESFELATRIGMRQTNVTLDLPHWDIVQKRDRLTGVSMTGLMKALDTLGWTHKDRATKAALRCFRTWANIQADEYAKEMNIPRPLLVTALKPEGTLTLLTDATSPGLHRSFSPYYIRRISVSELDPVCKALQHIGVPNEPKIESDNKDGTRRILFSFPIASNAPIASDDESTADQFDRYLTLQKEYTDHNSSCTLYVSRKEAKQAAKSVLKEWDNIVACAFLSKNEAIPYTLKEKFLDIFGLFKSKPRPYPQMPYEAITEQKYNEMMKTFPEMGGLGDIVNLYEQDQAEEDELDNADCVAGGHCPIR